MNLRRGDFRNDGYRFSGYTKSGKEHWLSPSVFAKKDSSCMTEDQLETYRKRSRDWYLRNSEKAKLSTQKWRLKNLDKVKANKMEWLSKPENRIKHSLSQAKRRAIAKGIKFEISIEDLLPLPNTCPVFGMQINYNGTGNKGFIDDCPSIDRIDSSKGYVKGNVQIISWRANRIKSDASIKEIIAVLNYMKGRINEAQ
jgi:hypothetical protein